MPPSWGWAAAKATGTSHIRAGKGCDDFGACAVAHHAGANILVMAVSDGAGSAECASVGSRLTTTRFLRSAFKFLKSGGKPAVVTEHVALEWLDDIRDRISTAARELDKSPRDFAATLVGCLVGPTTATFIHVGDGAAVFKLQDAEEWKIASWPTHGEYASTTYFVTDDPQPNVCVSNVEGIVRDVSLFSDGLERLVLDFSSQTAFAPFFDKVFYSFNPVRSGRNRDLSRQLRILLESRQVCEKTDDDKTIFLARRI